MKNYFELKLFFKKWNWVCRAKNWVKRRVQMIFTKNYFNLLFLTSFVFELEGFGPLFVALQQQLFQINKKLFFQHVAITEFRACTLDCSALMARCYLKQFFNIYLWLACYLIHFYRTF